MEKAKKLSSWEVEDYLKAGKTVYGVNMGYPKDGIYIINDLTVSDYFEMVKSDSNVIFWIIED